MQHYF